MDFEFDPSMSFDFSAVDWNAFDTVNVFDTEQIFDLSQDMGISDPFGNFNYETFSGLGIDESFGQFPGLFGGVPQDSIAIDDWLSLGGAESPMSKFSGRMSEAGQQIANLHTLADAKHSSANGLTDYLKGTIDSALKSAITYAMKKGDAALKSLLGQAMPKQEAAQTYAEIVATRQKLGYSSPPQSSGNIGMIVLAAFVLMAGGKKGRK